jgi:uncharacterized protein (TIGR02217 family)
VYVLGNYNQQRNAAWTDSIIELDADLGNITLTQYRTLENFFRPMFGGCHSFLIEDKIEKVSSAEGFGTGDGSTTTFQLKRTYTQTEASPYNGDTNSDVRNITKPKQGTISIFDNASLKTETTHYTVNYGTGVITFLSAPVNAHVLTWTGNYYLPVRFKDDSLDAVAIVQDSTATTGVMAVPNLTFEEVRAFSG